jgi:hypothetical protein
VWIEHHGSIPVDEHGRSYEIHHIDGDRKNNDISNLLCVSIQEHYNIHLRQGDYAACLRIAAKMQIPPNELKELAKKAAKKRWSDKSYRNLMKDTLTIVGNRPEVKNARKRNAKKLWKDEEYRNKQKETRDTLEHKEKMSIAQTLAWSNNRKVEFAEKMRSRPLLHCKCCDIFVKGDAGMGKHLISKKHLKNEAEKKTQ